jgi:acyl-CoA synthetase (AMP-forming)/AMP-acid ligase II
VPSTFYLLMRSADLSGYDLSSLRYVTQAGGRMEADQIRRFKELVPGTDFVVMYGQTEASARLAWVQPSELERKAGSAGQAIPGVEISIRDAAGDVLPPGEVGEICARGANVMMGYWADAEETASVLHDGWLHTGDLGHVDEDGYLFLVGRSREMIKSGAHRISPPEIEEVIRAIEGVRDVAVVGVEDEILGQVIKACVVPVAESDDLKRSIRRVCRERLPAFKIPKVIEFRPELPRTDSGKVQKHLL